MRQFQLPIFGFLYLILDLSVSLSKHPKLLLIVFDGFKVDYLDLITEERTPNLYHFLRNSARAKYLRPVNPTLTYPNHMTLLTGLNSESHGVVSNTFYDPELDDVFNWRNPMDDYMSKYFDVGAEPIWVTNQNAACDRYSGTVSLPCSLAPVKGVATTYRVDANWTDSQGVNPFVGRVDAIVDWFTRKVKPINLGLLYFDEPDHSGHNYGPNSPVIKDVIVHKMENITGYLMKQLKKVDLLDQVNIILVSDHGMSDTPRNQTVNIDLYINSSWINRHSPSFWPRKGHEDDILDMYEKLKDVPHLHIYKKNDPELVSRNVSNNRRIGPLYVWMDEGWTYITNATNISGMALGGHGFDNTVPNMHAILFGHGPAFKSGFFGPSMDTIDVYQLMCYILGVTPAPNNGTFDHARLLLRDEGGRDNSIITLTTFLVVVVLTASVAGIFGIALCRLHRYQKHTLRFRTISSHSTLHTEAGRSLLKSRQEEDDDDI